jgi:hypothetical protein
MMVSTRTPKSVRDIPRRDRCSIILRKRLAFLQNWNELCHFEVELAPSLVAYLQEKGVQEKGVASANARRHSVESVTYAGAEGGGILCRIITVGTDETLVVSLTQVKVALSRPFGLS